MLHVSAIYNTLPAWLHIRVVMGGPQRRGGHGHGRPGSGARREAGPNSRAAQSEKRMGKMPESNHADQTALVKVVEGIDPQLCQQLRTMAEAKGIELGAQLAKVIESWLAEDN